MTTYKIENKNLVMLIMASIMLLGTAIILIFTIGNEEKEVVAYVPDYDAQMYLSPREQEYTNGQEASLDVMIKSDGSKLDGADLLFSYNPSVVEITEITEGTVFPAYLNNKINAEEKYIQLTGLANPESPVEVDGKFCTLHFKVKKSGDPAFQIQYANGRTDESNLVSSESADDILVNVDNGNYIVN